VRSPVARRVGPPRRVPLAGRIHMVASVGTPLGGISPPSHSPANRPPRWAALSIPPTANPNPMLITIRKSSWLMIARLAWSTGWWTRPAAKTIPKSPKIAPDAPTANGAAPKTKLAAEPAAAQAR
jgi:hypothetical protein